MQSARWRPQGAIGGQRLTLLDMFSIQSQLIAQKGDGGVPAIACPSTYTPTPAASLHKGRLSRGL